MDENEKLKSLLGESWSEEIESKLNGWSAIVFKKPDEDDIFSEEQIKALKPAEVQANLEKVNKSLEHHSRMRKRDEMIKKLQQM
jgi:hypothetical protein